MISCVVTTKRIRYNIFGLKVLENCKISLTTWQDLLQHFWGETQGHQPANLTGESSVKNALKQVT